MKFYLTALVLMMASLTLRASDETNVSSGFTIKGVGLAVHGYDVVAFFSQQQPVLGSATFSTVFQGATYRFVNQAHLEQFEKTPKKYVPQFGGYCAYGVSVGAKFDGDPQFWKIVDGKLYLNLNGEIQEMWSQDEAGNIRKAHLNWKNIASKSPANLK